MTTRLALTAAAGEDSGSPRGEGWPARTGAAGGARPVAGVDRGDAHPAAGEDRVVVWTRSRGLET